MIELKRSAADQISCWMLTAMVAFVPLMLALGGLALLANDPGAGVLLLLFSAPMFALAYICLREAQARSFTRIGVDAHTLRLRLPSQRGFMAYGKLEADIPRTQIAALETRAEAFRSLGTTALQYVSSLMLTDGRRIILGADRHFTEPFYQNATNAIAAQMQLPVHNRGLVDGNPGFLLILGHSVPSWDAPSVAPAILERRVRDEGATWRLVALISSVALGIAALARAFGG